MHDDPMAPKSAASAANVLTSPPTAFNVRPDIQAASVASMAHYLSARKPIDHVQLTDNGKGDAGETRVFEVPVAGIFMHNREQPATLQVTLTDLGRDRSRPDERTRVSMTISVDTSLIASGQPWRPVTARDPIDRLTEGSLRFLSTQALASERGELMRLLDGIEPRSTPRPQAEIELDL
jgi:hypothetical protein